MTEQEQKQRDEMNKAIKNAVLPVPTDSQENSISSAIGIDPATGKPTFEVDYKNKGLDIYGKASTDKIEVGISKKFD